MAPDHEEEPFKVAIIGAGIGGATTAYYLRELFGPQVGITLFEQSGRIGGRMKAISFSGSLYETGASVYLSGHQYMASFVEKFGLELENKKHTTSRLALYNGENSFLFSTLRSNSLMANIRLFCRYGVELIGVKIRTRAFVSDLLQIYGFQNSGRCFTTPAEMLGALNPEFVEMTRWNYGDWLTKHDHLSEKFKQELCYGLISNDYCQNLDVHAFVGSFTLANLAGSLNTVKNGNQQIPEQLIQSALAENPTGSPKQFVHAQVTSISPTDGGKYQLEYRSPAAKQTMKESFDYVVIAAPLHQESSIRAAGGLTLPSDKFCSMSTTLCVGDMKQSVFGMTTSGLRKNISPFILPTWTGYMQRNCLFRSFSAVLDPNGKNYIWTVFSETSRMPSPEQTITSNYLDVVGSEKPQTFSWLAYPVYKAMTNPTEQLGSFVLARRLYYPNAIERIASCMEMAVIGGRNVALLIAAERKQEITSRNSSSKH